MNQPQFIKLGLDTDQVNVILKALGQFSHDQVRHLIDDILKQANSQLIPATEVLAPALEEEVE